MNTVITFMIMGEGDLLACLPPFNIQGIKFENMKQHNEVTSCSKHFRVRFFFEAKKIAFMKLGYNLAMLTYVEQ